MDMLEKSEDIIAYIKNSKKKTPVKVYIRGNLPNNIVTNTSVKIFSSGNFHFMVGEYEEIQNILTEYKKFIEDCYLENDRRNSGVPTLDYSTVNARIEPGAVIRDKVKIGDNAVIMMGAIINIGAEIGEGTMIDMGAVLGGRAIVGKNCHVGAGAVLAGVIEPPSAKPVIIEDNVVIGANAVIIEGVHVGKNAVIGAGAVVIEDVEENQVVAGNPAKVIKTKDEKTADKTKLVDDLRK
ncbi:2,3,4,5-tetrahydropyridine-2,6-dicarboxylate N-acetyltransferase [Brachyspira innocens]|uniref:2,3,4,5-tetrahydropyridine-2,6-dicarboxylate N-acetyltransferase n=1 Tax=Brachyspira innocens TaxID=13264 RepID=A0ABT8YTV7_9SPIR|nr:2,3,4,5-tetrahydropyridine-2,6-dicarboxylate N-acetyltransferase [Brachyspira innocens]MDO6992950.1 2,3,4,5-tetrahydropyridine-2,6-dicarboxylate N-acetyltransferase [Brachyspira innocens]MDO7019241.1 2,3,4,5-tetrahydropyridine-2,6-dicarboxylate N-acetyltransferase [Brachyspira innocens]